MSKPGLPAGTIHQFFEADHIPNLMRDDVAFAVYERLRPRLAELHWTDLWVLAKELNNGYLSDEQDAAVTEIYDHLTPKQVAEGKRQLADPAYMNQLRDAVVAPADAPASEVVTVGNRNYWKLKTHETGRSSQWPLGPIYKWLSSWPQGNSPEAVAEAMNAGVPPNAPMSDLIIDRNSAIGNVEPGLAKEVVLANLLKPDGKLIVSYAYHNDSPQSQLRPLTHFPEADPPVDLSAWGVVGKPLEWLLNLLRDTGTPLPEHMLGRMFAVGLPNYRFDSIPAASDMLMQEIESIRQHGKQYGIELPRAGNAAGKQVDFWTHSQAAPEVLSLTRMDIGGQALQASIRALSPPLGGSRLADKSPGGWAGRFLALVLGGSEAAEAISHLAPHRVRIPDHIILECRVKASFPTTGDPITPQMRFSRWIGGGRGGDGMVRERDAQHPCDPARTQPIHGDHLLSQKTAQPILEAVAKDHLTGESPANKSPFAEIGELSGPFLGSRGYTESDEFTPERVAQYIRAAGRR